MKNYRYEEDLSVCLKQVLTVEITCWKKLKIFNLFKKLYQKFPKKEKKFRHNFFEKLSIRRRRCISVIKASTYRGNNLLKIFEKFCNFLRTAGSEVFKNRNCIYNFPKNYINNFETNVSKFFKKEIVWKFSTKKIIKNIKKLSI